MLRLYGLPMQCIFNFLNQIVRLIVPRTESAACLPPRPSSYHHYTGMSVLDLGLVTQYRIAKSVGCFQRRLFVCLFVSVHAPHPQRTSSTILVRLCTHSFCCQSQIPRLRSSGSAVYVLPRTRTRFGERGFSYSGPAAWNSLPSDLHDITDTSTFRKRLKSVLFDRSCH